MTLMNMLVSQNKKSSPKAISKRPYTLGLLFAMVALSACQTSPTVVNTDIKPSSTPAVLVTDNPQINQTYTVIDHNQQPQNVTFLERYHSASGQVCFRAENTLDSRQHTLCSSDHRHWHLVRPLERTAP